MTSTELDTLATAAASLNLIEAPGYVMNPETGNWQSEFPLIDNFGRWYYWLVEIDPETNQMRWMRDKNNNLIWHPEWHYSLQEAVAWSCAVRIARHYEKDTEFSESTITEYKLNDPSVYYELLKYNLRLLEHREHLVPFDVRPVGMFELIASRKHRAIHIAAKLRAMKVKRENPSVENKVI